MTRETAILSRRLRGAYHVVVHENDSCRLGHVERSGESLARCRQDFSGGPDRNLVVTEQTTSIVEQQHAKVLAPVIGELSRSLLNLAERDGRASYPQFTARRRVPT